MAGHGVVALTIGLLAAAAGARADEPLRLRCEGKGSGLAQSEGLHFLAKGGVSTTTTYRQTHFESVVLVEVKDGAARLHLPSSLVTQVNSGGVDGWWTASELKLGDDAISGRLRLNIVNKPAFRIDRMTGDIDLDGAYPFHGVCEKTTAVERKF